DPKTFLDLIDSPGGKPRIPRYRYSQSTNSLFLGVTDARVLLPRFGNWNIWYSAGVEPAPDLYDAGLLDEPRALYVNSPTLVKRRNNGPPPGHATVTAFAPCSFQACRNGGRAAAAVWKDKQVGMLIDLIDRRFAPGLRAKLGAICLRT